MPPARHVHRPSTVTEAVGLLRAHRGRVAPMGGGTLLNSRDARDVPEHLVCLDALGLDGVTHTGSELVLGATLTLQGLLDRPDVPASIQAGCRHVENRSIRNVATLGGHIGARQTYGDVLPILVALGARVELAGGRIEPVLGYLAAPPGGELIVAVRIALEALRRAWGVSRFARSHNDVSTVTAAATLGRDGDRARDPILAMGGVAPAVVRLAAVEAALDGRAPPDRDALEALVAGQVSPAADIRGGSAFKSRLAGVVGARALLAACAMGGL